MLGNMEPMMLANMMILANIEPQMPAMVKYLRLAWEQRQARGIFRARLGETANVPHAVSTSYRPLDILSTVNQMTKRMVAGMQRPLLIVSSVHRRLTQLVRLVIGSCEPL